MREVDNAIGYLSPAEAEANYYATLDEVPKAAWH